MNAISEPQPFASAFALGLRTVLTRSWKPPESCIGERFAIASTVQKPWPGSVEGTGWAVSHRLDDGEFLLRDEGKWAEGHALPLGCVVASGVLTDAVRITGCESTDRSYIALYPDEGSSPHRRGGWWLIGQNDVTRGTPTRLSDTEVAFGQYEPSRWAWLFSDLAATTERCPWCIGLGQVQRWVPVLGAMYGDGGTMLQTETCPVCDGAGSCPPFPVKGKQRVWKWEPEKEAV